MKNKTKKTVAFVILFAVIGVIASKIPFTNIIGSSTAFSLFDFIGPISGMFLGVWGALSVLLVKIIDYFLSGSALDTTTIIRLFPMMGAALYMASKKKYIVVIPVIAMIMFWLTPEGRGAWYYAIYWLIPIACVFLKKRLIFNALGATFTAHCIGSVAFLYAFHLPSAVWIGLIPVVWMERGLMALGIWVSYVVFNWAIEKIVVKKLRWTGFESLVNPNYLPTKKFFKSFS